MFTIIFSKIFLKIKIKKKDQLTIVFMIIGIGFVGYSGYVKTSEGKKSSKNDLSLGNLFLGIPLTLTANMLSSLLYVTFESVLKKKNTDPLRFCSMSGIYGLITNLFIIMMASFMPCFSSKMCDMGGYLEDPIVAIKSLVVDSVRLKYLGIYGFVTPFFIFSLMYISKNIGAVYLTVTKNLYCITIWVSSVLLKLENFEVKSFIFELAGFVFIVLGTLVFNNVLFRRIGVKKEDEYIKEFKSFGGSSLEKEGEISEMGSKLF